MNQEKPTPGPDAAISIVAQAINSELLSAASVDPKNATVHEFFMESWEDFKKFSFHDYAFSLRKEMPTLFSLLSSLIANEVNC